MYKQSRVVISGIGILAANGTGKEDFWRTLLAAESGLGPITLFDASELECKIAGEIKQFNPLDYMPASTKPQRMGRFSQLAIAATSMALEDAGLTGIERELIDLLPITLGVSTSDFQSYSTT
jgi:3-oxoacyl-[acyl-carrier-protein] synthase II